MTQRGTGQQPVFPRTETQLAEWRRRPEVLGVVLVGSKSRGYGDGLSDDDLEVIVTDEHAAGLAPADCLVHVFEGEGEERRLIWDAQILAYSGLRAKEGSRLDIDHWPYERSPVLFDRNGAVVEAVRAAARMDADFRKKRLLHGTIDAWIPPRRAVKTRKRGHEAAVRALIDRGARALCRVLFALEWRWVPLDHWLEQELRTLDDPTGAGPAILRALSDADPDPLIEALQRLSAEHDEIPPREDWLNLFLELIHPSRAEERGLFALE